VIGSPSGRDDKGSSAAGELTFKNVGTVKRKNMWHNSGEIADLNDLPMGCSS
jgi:hypothetical protein